MMYEDTPPTPWLHDAYQPAVEPLPDYMAGINQAYADNAALGQQQQREKPKFNIGDFLLGWAGYLGDNLAGNNSYAKHALAQADEKRERAHHEKLAQQLFAAGVPPSQIPLLLTNPEAIGSQFATRLQTRTVDEGSSVYTPNPDGRAHVFTAPKTFSEGADVMQSPAVNTTLGAPLPYPGTAQVPGAPRRLEGLRSEAEQYADTLAPRTSKNWRSAISDYVLKGDGPTANAHDRDIWGQRLSTTRRGQDIGSSDRRRGQDITDKRVRGSAGYQGRGRNVGVKRGDLIGPVFQRNGRRIQYSKSKVGYVDLATGERVN